MKTWKQLLNRVICSLLEAEGKSICKANLSCKDKLD